MSLTCNQQLTATELNGAYTLACDTRIYTLNSTKFSNTDLI